MHGNEEDGKKQTAGRVSSKYVQRRTKWKKVIRYLVKRRSKA